MKIWLGKRWVQMSLMIIFGLAFGWLVSELSFAATLDRTQREPTRVELLIPEGTAEKIKAGLPVPSIPSNMTFSIGDLLVVKNMDVVSHQLGPVWVPAQSSGVLQIGTESSYTYHCSFTQTQVFGLEVQPALTTSTRVQGILLVGLPTGVMLAVFSLAVPQKKKDPSAEA
jgi:hypothetical protein